MNVGFIGLGAMGLGMARNLVKGGYLTSVYNRTHCKAQQFSEETGVISYANVVDLAKNVDVIVMCVSADNDVLAVVNELLKGIRENSIVVDVSTVSRETAQQAAHLLAEKNVHFLDAPVSGGVEGAKNGTLAMMVGGSATALEQVRPILQTMAGRITHLGDVGCGQATKAVNQVMAAGINQAVTEALAFAQRQGLPMDKVIDVISGGAAGNWFLEHRGMTMTHDFFSVGFKVALHQKDLKICQAMAKQVDMPVPLVDMTVQNYAQLIEQGHGDDDISALYRLKRI